MRLKQKTLLRDFIKDRRNSSGGLDLVWFFKDGDWQITGRNRIIPNTLHRTFKELGFKSPHEAEDYAITRNFKKIEEELEKGGD